MNAISGTGRGSHERVAVLGLGRMGGPIASRLHRHHETIGFDPDRSRQDSARTSGLRLAVSGADAIIDADVVVSVLPGAAVERGALLGESGLLALMRPGQLLVELTSGDPQLADDLQSRADDRGVVFVAAPMGGAPPDAAAGTLTFFMAGSDEATARATAILGHLARPGGVRHVGPAPRDAQTVKLLINALWFGQVELAAEVLLLGAGLGLAPSRLLPVLRDSAAASRVLSEAVPHALEGDYMETFGLDAVVEELDAVSGLADGIDAPAHLLRQIAAAHRDALASLGPVDGELRIIDALERVAGVTLREAG